MNIEDEMELMFYMQNSKEMPNPMKLYFDDTNIIVYSTDVFLIAYSELLENDAYCYLRNIYIRKECRNNKIGTLVIKGLIESCKLKNIKSIEVESENKSICFFEKLGFKMININCNRMKLCF